MGWLKLTFIFLYYKAIATSFYTIFTKTTVEFQGINLKLPHQSTMWSNVRVYIYLRAKVTESGSADYSKMEIKNLD